jgi:very-short-patch-repair endonuclease
MPHQVIPPSNRRLAKVMRQRLTPAELKLWQNLRDRRLDGLRFRRQAPLGPYVVDFFRPERNLVIEVGGGQHARIRGLQADTKRDEWIRSQGHVVLRFANQTVMKRIDRVCDAIVAASRSSSSVET